MLTALVLTCIVLSTLCLGYLAHEAIQSEKAYRRARMNARFG
jgi:hypothetical protein